MSPASAPTPARSPTAPAHAEPSRRPWAGLDAASREQAFSPSSCIGGDYRPFIAAYAERSVQARAACAALGGCWRELRSGPLPAQRLDLCLPASASPADPVALLVFLHGGYWQELSAAQSLFAATGCLAAGHAFAAVDYTLAPAASLPQIVAECGDALRVLREHSTALGIDARRIVLAGSSAGAHLAAMLALSSAADVAAAVLVSGIYELEPLIGTTINDALGLDAATARAMSPLLAPPAALAAWARRVGPVLCWGEVETDAFKAQSQAFAERLGDCGAACTCLEVPQRNHFDVILDLTDAGTALGRHTLDLLHHARS
jgi:arylformamidase